MLLTLSALAIGAGALLHVRSVQHYNSLDRLLADGQQSSVCTVDIVSNATWPKEDALIETVKEGGQFDMTVSNIGSMDIADWELKIKPGTECYLNQGWNGTVEIHQGVSGRNEMIQTLDLHNFDFDYDDVKLEYVGRDKNNLMIHLYPGDYVVYHPTNINQMSEAFLPADSGSESSSTVGLIFYYADGVELTDYELTYHFAKSVTEGTGYYALLAAAILWGLALLSLIVWRLARVKSEHELREREAMLVETLDLISHFVDAKDPYTNGHSERVAEYAKKIAEKMGFSQSEVRYAFYAGMLHDVGKSYVPDEILKKKGRLTDEEYKCIKSHTTSGYEMLRNIKSIPGIADGASCHHERYDGKGYPNGLSGVDIPLLARIICVADSFDAMNSTRCYRKNLTKDFILKELKDNEGRQFDPDVAEAMLELIEQGDISIEDDPGSEE